MRGEKEELSAHVLLGHAVVIFVIKYRGADKTVEGVGSYFSHLKWHKKNVFLVIKVKLIKLQK